MDFRCRYCLEIFKSKRSDKQFCSNSHRAQYGNLSKKRKADKDEAFNALPAIKEIDAYEILPKADFEETMKSLRKWLTEKHQLNMQINELKYQLEQCRESTVTPQRTPVSVQQPTRVVEDYRFFEKMVTAVENDEDGRPVLAKLRASVTITRAEKKALILKLTNGGLSE